MAQGEQAYGVDWQTWDAPPLIPPGDFFTWNSSWTTPLYSATSVGTTTAQTRDESGPDWHYSVCVVRDELGEHIGYAAAGYAGFVNWGSDDGCYTSIIEGTIDAGKLRRNERYPSRRGALVSAVARYDLNGALLWYKSYQPGVLFDIIQDRSGDLVVTGEAYAIRPLPHVTPSVPMLYNPHCIDEVCDEQDADDPMLDCSTTQRQLSVMKIDLDGDVIWNHIYNHEADLQDGIELRASGQGLIETNIDDQPGYRVVGYAWPSGAVNDNVNRVALADLDADGYLKETNAITLLTSLPGQSADVGQCRGLQIARTPFDVGEYYAITGMRRSVATPNHFAAFLWVTEDDNTVFFKDTEEDGTELGLSTTQQRNSNGVCFAMEGTQPSVVWPVLTDLVGTFFAGNKEATALVYRFSLEASEEGDPLWTTPADLGRVRAFDLFVNTIQTMDGNIAFTSTKWPEPYAHTVADFFSWADLPEDVQDCLSDLEEESDPPDYSYGIDAWNSFLPPSTAFINNGANPFGYFGTQSYVAKLDLADGSLLWDVIWSEGTGANATNCYEDNYRQRQCNFKIVEADDGGLVVCGNTGHNMDDAYLARLGNCDQLADYSTSPALDGNGEHRITSNTTWNTDRNIRGSIVVENGATLTINNGATIRFADSRAIGLTTNIVVEVGGKLAMTTNSELTSLEDCENSMWDGILVLGNPSAGQATHQQGEVDISNSTISNAVTAIYAGNGDIWDPFASSTQNGGIIRLTNMTFTNNLYGIVHRPYTVTANASRVRSCTFQTTAALNYSNEVPANHITVISRWKLDVEGSTFRNTSGLFPDDPQNWGTGIEGFNSNIWVIPDGSTPCSFERLSCGLLRQNVGSGRSARVLESRFEDCARGVLLRGLNVPWILENTFEVPDLDVSGLGIASAYGIFLEETTGFDFQENTFTGPGTGADHPNVGAIFVDIGEAYNEYYNNIFDGFTDAGGNSAGTIIMGENDGPNTGDGLVIKCNDYSNTTDNVFDVAFTGVGVTIGDRQGGDFDQADPAGNTFASGCTSGVDEQNFFNPDQDIAEFTYFHHDPSSTAAQIVPECATDPPIIVSGGSSWYEGTSFIYTKTEACPTASSMMMSMEGWMDEAEEHGSLLAESASISEAAHHHAQMAKALYRLTELALNDSVGTNLDLAIAAHEEMAMANSRQMRFGLHLAKGDTAEALMIMAEALEEDPGSVYWSLLNDYWDRLLAQEDPYAGEVSTSALESIATSGNRGRSVAIAWLAGMGIRIPEYFILPGSSSTQRKATWHEDQSGTEVSQWGLAVFPNPSEGLVQFRVLQPDGSPNAELHVYDIAGHTVAVHRINAQGLTSLSLQLAPGVYIAALDSGGLRQKQSKFMVIR